MKGIINFFKNVLYISLLNFFFLFLPLVIPSLNSDMIKSYQIWFNILFLLYITLPKTT